MATPLRVPLTPLEPEPGVFSPLAPQSFDPLTHRIGIPDVPDQTLMDYMQIAPEPNEALQLARLDKIWVQVAKEYGILTGDKKKDRLIWEDHQMYVQGAPGVEEPLTTSDDAVEEFMRRVMMNGEEEPERSRRAKRGERGSKEPSP